MLYNTERIVLAAMEAQGPVSAHTLAVHLNLDETRGVRTAIHGLRRKGEAIWHDPELGAFPWGDDQAPGSVPHQRWTRSHAAAL